MRACVRVILTGQLLSCLWADLNDTLVDGRDRSWLPGGAQICHQVALLEGEEGGEGDPVDFSAVCGPIWLILWWIVEIGQGYLATRWRPDLPPGGAARICFFSAVYGPTERREQCFL